MVVLLHVHTLRTVNIIVVVVAVAFVAVVSVSVTSAACYGGELVEQLAFALGPLNCSSAFLRFLLLF